MVSITMSFSTSKKPMYGKLLKNTVVSFVTSGLVREHIGFRKPKTFDDSGSSYLRNARNRPVFAKV